MGRPKREPTPEEREVILKLRPGHSLEEVRAVLAERFPPARHACNLIRTELLEMDTDHFDDEAAITWGGVDEIKSGLNAAVLVQRRFSDGILTPYPKTVGSRRRVLLTGKAQRPRDRYTWLLAVLDLI